MDLKRLVINLLTTNANGTLYYVFVYIQFVLLTPLLGKLARSKFSWVGWLVTPLCTVIKYYWLINNIEPNKIINNIWTVSCVGWFTFYYMGLLLGNGILKKKYNIKGLFAAYFLSVIVQMLERGAVASLRRRQLRYAGEILLLPDKRHCHINHSLVYYKRQYEG